MTMYKEILRLHFEGSLSQRDIAASCRCAHSTVKRILARAAELELDFARIKDISDNSLARMLYPQAILPRIQKEPDYAHIHKELAKSGVTLTLLWNEYCEACQQNGDIPYMYSQFSKNYKEYAAANSTSMHIIHKPAEVMEVDWAGTKILFHDAVTGKEIKASLFTACLPYSGYAYAEAFADEKLDSWLTAHIHAYAFFGGSARILRPDNLKTGVTKSDKYDPEINSAYRELAEYYGAFVSPARVRKPKDKPTVEGTVGMLTTHIIAAVRNTEYHSLKDINKDIFLRLRQFNERPFQKKDGSRSILFCAEERQYLNPLPEFCYQIAHYRDVIVPATYHIQTEDRKYYSVPYEYVRKKVTVRSTASMIEVFCDGERIACHIRNKGLGQYVTDSAHMPEAHRQLYAWDNDRFLEWGAEIGANTLSVIQKILTKNGRSLPGYKFCMGLVSLRKRYAAQEIEDACMALLALSSTPSLKSMKLALSAVTAKRIAVNESRESHAEPLVTGFRRGADYYRGENND